tara:strand:- start:1260 stop:2054 length:795 start_codon:yes stop_codon:yes gene_type:complete
MAHFEEIDSDDDHVLEKDDCDIEICDGQNFVELIPNNLQGTNEYEPKIGNTLENIGKMILISMFIDAHKKDVVQSLMKLFDNELQYTEPFALMNEESHKLHVLYQDKYTYLKEHLEKYKNYVFQIIRESIKKCKGLIMEKQEQLVLLKASAQRILSTINKADFIKQNIVKEEFEKVCLHIKRDYDSFLKLVKTNFQIEEYNNEDSFILSKTKEIQIASSKVSTTNSNILRSKYEAEIKNLEFHISKEIQNECEQYWLEAMGISK